MYILTPTYKDSDNKHNSPMVSVLDTTDGTLEVVNYFDAIRADIDIQNVWRDRSISSTRIMPYNKDLFLALLDCYKPNDFVTIHDGNLTVGGQSIEIWIEKYDEHKVNGIVLPVEDDDDVFLASLFTFREYTILRFMIEKGVLDEPDWLSVAVNKRGGIKYWSADYKIASKSPSQESDAGFGMQVDLVHEGR